MGQGQVDLLAFAKSYCIKYDLFNLIDSAQILANRPADVVSNHDLYVAVTVIIHKLRLYLLCQGLMGLTAWSYRWLAKQLPGQSP